MLMAAVIGILSLPSIVLHILGIGAIISVILIVGSGLIYVYKIAATEIGIRHARRDKAKAEAAQGQMVIHTDGYGMTHLINLTTGHSQNLTLDARAYRNGHFELPHPVEQQNLHLILGSRFAGSAKAVIQQQRPQLSPPQKLDFYRVMMQPLQTYAIIAGQQVGKTFIAQAIAAEWIKRDYQPLMVGPKWDIGEWPGCKCVGGKEDFEAVSEGLEQIRRIAQTRHESDKGHKEHPLQVIFIDDWTLIKVKCSNAEDLILEASTFYASVNMILYFIIHTDTAHAWGVGKEGAALKNNFIKLFLEPQFSSYGEVISRQGFVVFPAQTTRREIELPGNQLIISEYVEISKVCACPGCTNPVNDNQTYCSNACKQRAYRGRVTP